MLPRACTDHLAHLVDLKAPQATTLMPLIIQSNQRWYWITIAIVHLGQLLVLEEVTMVSVSTKAIAEMSKCQISQSQTTDLNHPKSWRKRQQATWYLLGWRTKEVSTVSKHQWTNSIQILNTNKWCKTIRAPLKCLIYLDKMPSKCM